MMVKYYLAFKIIMKQEDPEFGTKTTDICRYPDGYSSIEYARKRLRQDFNIYAKNRIDVSLCEDDIPSHYTLVELYRDDNCPYGDIDHRFFYILEAEE